MNKHLLRSVSVLAGLGTISCTALRKEDATPPNVLIILADDQRADALGCAGNPYIRTPNIDSLAFSGTRFVNAYVMGGHHGAISAPSRAMLMTGRYLFNIYDKLNGVTTMPMHFAANGYVTFGTGKWHNEKSAFEASFKNADAVFLGGMSDHFNVPARTMLAGGKLSEPDSTGFSTDVFADAAMKFLNAYAGSERKNPFFCYIAFTAPHDPYSPHPDYLDEYDDQSLPLPGNFMPLHPFQFDNLTVRDENLSPWPRTPEVIRSALADYYSLITHLDTKVGEIILLLKSKGLFDNTIIVYAADNGLAIGSHGLLGKQNLYEHSMKVPLIIRGPGLPQDKSSEALVYLSDIYPTLAGLCKLDAGPETDGESLIPVIKGESEGVRNSLFTAYRNTIRAVRTNEWKLIRYPERHYSQFFNLKSDPLELNNLAGDSRYQTKQEELMTLMGDWQKQTNDTARLTSGRKLPMEYDHTKLTRKPDIHQPEYTLDKYFR